MHAHICMTLYVLAQVIECVNYTSLCHYHSPLQAAWNDRFRGHECGQYREVKANPQLVIDCLTEAGEQYNGKWLSSRL